MAYLRIAHDISLPSYKKMPSPSTTFAPIHQPAAPIDLAKFLLRRYFDPCATRDTEGKSEQGMPCKRPWPNLFFTDRGAK